MSQTNTNFVPYPEYDDPNFYKKIYSKKEFFRTKAPPVPPQEQISKHLKDVCNPKQFTIQNYQEFVRNFISSTTNYNGMLLFWGVGTGKCVSPDTVVCLNGCLECIQSIWDTYNDGSYTPDECNGQWSKPKIVIKVNTLNQESGKIIECPINRLYRQKICEPINVVTLANGCQLKLTKQHHLLTEKGWTNQLDTIKQIAVPRRIINQYNVKNIGVNLAQFLGWHMAMGNEPCDTTNLLIMGIDEAICDNLIEQFSLLSEENKMGKPLYSVERHDQKVFLRIECPDYVNYLKQHGYVWGLPTTKRTFPQILMTASIEEVRVFLRAYCDAKLSIDQKVGLLEFPPMSKTSVDQLTHLFKLFELELVKKQVGAYMSAMISNEYMWQYWREIGFSIQVKKTLLSHLIRPSQQKYVDDVIMIDVKELHEELYDGYVYDIEIMDHHNYVANGIICHNTCGAIQIAEGLKDVVKRLDKKIYVLTKSQIRANFLKELYSFDRAKKEIVPGSMQCTGNTYHIPPSQEPILDHRKKKVKEMIRQSYKFMGPRQFANYVDTQIKGHVPGTIGQYFSNSVFVIDEAHGLTKTDLEADEEGTKHRKKTMKKTTVSEEEDDDEDEDEEDVDEEEEEEGSDEGKHRQKGKKKPSVSKRRIIDIFEEIFKDSVGIKLILLTATPMKDTAQDLVLILDLLLRNDKRPSLKDAASAEAIEKYGEFLGDDVVKHKKMTYEDLLFKGEDEVNDVLLKDLARGYVSYVRGENPASFPIVVNAEKDENHPYLEVYIPHPLLTDKWEKFPKKDYMRYIEVVKCRMSMYQYSNYLAIIKRKPDEKKKSSKSEMKIHSSMQASNIVFPTKTENIGEYGSSGFKGALKETSMTIDVSSGKKGGIGNKKKTVSVFDYQEKMPPFLKLEEIGKYSEKFKTLLLNVIHSKGIVYVYTDFVQIGARLIALMLEQNGYKRFVNEKLAKLGVKPLWNPASKYVATANDLQCALCERKKGNHDDSWHKFTQATYILFTGKEKYFSQTEIDLINDKDRNSDGETIKIIVGTRVSGEGIDYKMIREVHIMDPWHNNTRLYQVIGRAARHCSHYALDPSERKVTVFRYCSSAPIEFEEYSKDRTYNELKPYFDKIVPGSKKFVPFTFKELFAETSDEKVYRRVERKDKFVKKVERILKIVAVDCALNRNINIFHNYLKDDKDRSRECDYMECDYKCEGFDDQNPPDRPKKINLDTYNLYFSEPQIARVQLYITELFRTNFVMKLENIIYETILRFPGVDVEFIFEAVDRIIGYPPQKSPTRLTDRFSRPGRLIFADPYYIFQPDDLSDEKAPLYYKTTPLTVKNKAINLEPIREQAKITAATTQEAQQAAEKTVNIKEKITQLMGITDKYEMHYELARIVPDIQAQIFEAIVFSKEYENKKRFIKILNDYFAKDGKLYIVSLTKGEELLGHHINGQNRLYSPKKLAWVNEKDDVSLASLMLRDVSKPRNADRLKRPLGDIVGYVVFEKGEYKFKIMDLKAQEKKRKKLKEDYSIKTYRKGKVCKNYSVAEIRTFMDLLEMEEPSGRSNREKLCIPIELQCRKLDDIDKEHRWFYSEQDLANYMSEFKKQDGEEKKVVRKKKVTLESPKKR